MNLAYRFLAGVVLLGAGAAAGCGGETHTVAECAGAWSGDYVGGVSGTLSGMLDPDGTFRIGFAQTGFPAVEGSSVVGPDGKVMFDISGNMIEGHLDLGRCTATGTWVYASLVNGTWKMARNR